MDETTPAQRPQMPAHRGEGDAHSLRELPGPMRSLPQEIDDPPAMRIGKGGERPVEAWRAQRACLNFRPVAFSISSRDTSRMGCEKVQ